jgi:hypothetical protein
MLITTRLRSKNSDGDGNLPVRATDSTGNSSNIFHSIKPRRVASTRRVRRCASASGIGMNRAQSKAYLLTECPKHNAPSVLKYIGLLIFSYFSFDL